MRQTPRALPESHCTGTPEPRIHAHMRRERSPMESIAARPARLPVSNRYEFQKPLGSGGVGTVYRALDRRTGELVAVKVLHFRASQNPTVHKRLAREFQA